MHAYLQDSNKQLNQQLKKHSESHIKLQVQTIVRTCVTQFLKCNLKHSIKRLQIRAVQYAVNIYNFLKIPFVRTYMHSNPWQANHSD